MSTKQSLFYGMARDGDTDGSKHAHIYRDCIDATYWLEDCVLTREQMTEVVGHFLYYEPMTPELRALLAKYSLGARSRD